jgi:mono/diheme cytochrome c family protein
MAVGAVALGLVIAACGDGEADTASSAASPPSQAEAAENGMQVYERNCATCHGDDLSGKVGPALGPGSNAAALGDDQLEIQIREGGNGMPGWDGLIPEEDIEAVIAYLRSVQAGS